MSLKKLHSRLLLPLALTLFAAACSKIAAQNPIVGTWDIENGLKASYQFRSNGTGSLTMMGHTAEGTYHYDGQQLEFIGTHGETLVKYPAKVTNDELEITAEGHLTKFRRKS